MKIQILYFVFLFILQMTAQPLALAAKPPPGSIRDRHEIAVARFGDKERGEYLKQAYQVKAQLDKAIFGQGRATKVTQDRLVQYIESFGSRQKDPIAEHFIGFPGVGKSAMLDTLRSLGFPIESLDVQQYIKVDEKGDSPHLRDLARIAGKHIGKPYILLIDELDKLPEKTPAGEETRPFIGALNQILTDGYTSDRNGTQLNFSNVFIITTMNFSPDDVERFSEDALKQKKGYYDFTLDDFALFDSWINQDPGARYKLLSHLFRANTVSRIAPNTVIMKPLLREDYDRIVRANVDKTIATTTQGNFAQKRIEVTYTDAFVDFLVKQTVFAPSGARETVYKSNALAEQLIGFATKLKTEGDESLDRPRKIQLDYDTQKNQAVIRVTPLITKAKKTSEGASFSVSVAYDSNARLFIQPENIATTPPESYNYQAPVDPRKLIKDARFPKDAHLADGFAKHIDKILLGQKIYTKMVEKELNTYLSRQGPAVKEPSYAIIAGFPGIGKSELVKQASEFTGLGVARINMQAFSSDDPQVLTQFSQMMSAEIMAAKARSKTGKYIVLIEELDKIFEIAPDGRVVNRPIMALIKDLLNEGVADSPWSGSIDIRDAMTFVTMNFAVDRFGFEADPRLTSIEDVEGAWKKLSMNPAELKKILGAMFLPETVSRMISRFYIMKPLAKADFQKLIHAQIERVTKVHLRDQKSGENRLQIDLQLTKTYEKYLYNETVIPSEGARYTVLASEHRIVAHMEATLAELDKSSALATEPLILELDFNPKTTEVLGTVRPQKGRRKGETVLKQVIPLTFPPLRAYGEIPAERLLTGVHEFGHAFSAVRLGLRFEYSTVVPPKVGVGGYVKFRKTPQTAKTLLASLYSGLASRAMERIFLSDDPAATSSVISITPGASSDILGVTKTLWDVLYEYGLDPEGGTMERRGQEGLNEYARFNRLTPEMTEQFGMLLRDMENLVIKDFLAAHDASWYREKILTFATEGGVAEQDFYKIIGYPHPGDNDFFMGEQSKLLEIFKGKIQALPDNVKKAASFKQGKTGTTAEENMNLFSEAFMNFAKARLHPATKASAVGCSEGMLLGAQGK